MSLTSGLKKMSLTFDVILIFPEIAQIHFFTRESEQNAYGQKEQTLLPVNFHHAFS